MGISESKRFLLEIQNDLFEEQISTTSSHRDFSLCPLMEILNDPKNSSIQRKELRKLIFDTYYDWIEKWHPDTISSSSNYSFNCILIEKDLWKKFMARSWFVTRFLGSNQISNTFKIFYKQKAVQNSKE